MGVDRPYRLEPLVEKDPCRDQTQRRQPRPRHGCQREPGLPASGRQDDKPPPSAELPRPEGGILIRPEVDGGPTAGRWSVRPHHVAKRHAPACQPRFDAAVEAGRGAVGVDARIPPQAGGLRQVEASGRIDGDDRATVEDQAHGPMGSNARATAVGIRLAVLRRQNDRNRRRTARAGTKHEETMGSRASLAATLPTATYPQRPCVCSPGPIEQPRASSGSRVPVLRARPMVERRSEAAPRSHR